VLVIGHFGQYIGITWKVLNVVLEKDGEDHLDRSCDKFRYITYSQGAEEYPT
jgi:hypothetical protein